ncbi:MAG TPA: hypothetical protein VF559_08045 [Caulobacteraceae bacterium]|jgi:outer membrane biosynthesis protein TonB
MAEDGKTGSGGMLGNKKVLIAIALAVAALIIGILLMRGQGDEAANMSGPDTAATQAAGMNVGEDQAGAGGLANTTPLPGQPNPAPTENIDTVPGDAPAVAPPPAPATSGGG